MGIGGRVESIYSSVSGAGRDYAAEDMRISWSSRTTVDLREETGVRSSVDAAGELEAMGRLHKTGAGKTSVRDTV
jgi:hypothetical protein